VEEEETADRYLTIVSLLLLMTVLPAPVWPEEEAGGVADDDTDDGNNEW
jgi:hypothetical protein